MIPCMKCDKPVKERGHLRCRNCDITHYQDRDFMAFSRAGWTKTVPTEPGCYPVAWREGHASVVMVDGKSEKWHERIDWWWAKRLPNLPDPPAVPSVPNTAWVQGPSK